MTPSRSNVLYTRNRSPARSASKASSAIGHGIFNGKQRTGVNGRHILEIEYQHFESATAGGTPTK